MFLFPMVSSILSGVMAALRVSGQSLNDLGKQKVFVLGAGGLLI